MADTFRRQETYKGKPRKMHGSDGHMKRVSMHRSAATLAMIVAMSVHIFSGFGVFCANKALRPLRSLGIFPVAFEIARPGPAGRLNNGKARFRAESRGGTSPRCCNMMKKCPVVTRGVTTSNQTRKLHEAQFATKSGAWISCPAIVTDHRLNARGGRPLMELAWCMPFFRSDPLAVTTILLI
jgi:hypothetical protein